MQTARIHNQMLQLRRLLRKLSGRGTDGDRMFRTPRCWSNRELRRFSHLFSGTAINVSAWQDKDKEGRYYREYFSNVLEYHISNYGTTQGALQGSSNEIFLDLTAELSQELRRKYDVVFNHTTLEHVYDFQTAFTNLCELSSDIVIIVVPWLQQMHTDYGDYWRFSPQALSNMFSERGLTMLYLSWNDHPRSAVYVFAIAARKSSHWLRHFPDERYPGPDSSDFLDLPSPPPGARAF